MSKLFSQPNFKTETVTINGTAFKLQELSAASMLDYTEYCANCADEMKEALDSCPKDHKEWSERHIQKVQTAHTVFKVRARTRLVALSVRPAFAANPEHPLATATLPELEETLVQELKPEQLKEMEAAALLLNEIPGDEQAVPKPGPDAILPTS